MSSPSSILNVGRWALFASQAALQVTGENIANVDTEGYARRRVVLEEGPGIDYYPGQIGTGVRATQIMRSFDEFVELQYYSEAAKSSRWEALDSTLGSVEALFNESKENGISGAISAYFNSWNDLTQDPSGYASRLQVVNQATTLSGLLNQADTSLAVMQDRVELLIDETVKTANQLMEDIAELNRQINIHHIEGSNTPNSLYDKRDLLVRSLGETIDINYIDNGRGEVTITTLAGQVLVDGQDHFLLEYSAGETTKDLYHSSTFDGELYYEGNDTYEYTLEFVDPANLGNEGAALGMVSNGSAAAQFRVSLDGGNTWLTDENGDVKYFYARPEDGKVQVENLDIWFGTSADPAAAPAQNFTAGDRFTIVPKKALYWVRNTSHKENITPQIFQSGEDNTRRVRGGTLAAYFNFHDDYVGKYRDKLDTFTENLIWNVNRLHSQGTGQETYSFMNGTYSVDHTDMALGSDSTGLYFNRRLQSGSSMMYVYNTSTGNLASGAALDWSAAAGQQNFNPDVHTLSDAAAAINRTFNGALTATLVNNQLRIEAQSGYNFAFGTDSTGIYAALGLNTFFKGTDAGSIAVCDHLGSDLDHLATGHVNGAGEMNSGDITTAQLLYDVKDMEMAFVTFQEGSTTSTLLEYYNGLVTNVGRDVANVSYNKDYTKALTDNLNDRQQSMAGVNLDEEMTNLVMYQHAYTAAAKLITTADEMLQTVLALKQ